MATRSVEIKRQTVSSNELEADKGYAMIGNKGIFILVRNHEGNFNFVRIDEPSLTSKPNKTYSCAQTAVEEKIRGGYTVVEYDCITDLFD